MINSRRSVKKEDDTVKEIGIDQTKRKTDDCRYATIETEKCAMIRKYP